MRFIADESCDFGVVRLLRQAGFDITAVGEISPRIDDTEVIRLASEQKRILITEDKDFGQLVYAHAAESEGVILLRYVAGRGLELPRTYLRPFSGTKRDWLVPSLLFNQDGLEFEGANNRDSCPH